MKWPQNRWHGMKLRIQQRKAPKGIHLRGISRQIGGHLTLKNPHFPNKGLNKGLRRIDG